MKTPPVTLQQDVEAQIRARFRRADPLNITAVKRESPMLIERLFDPNHFIGWRSALIACGIDPANIVVELEETVPCRLCEFEGMSLMSHLRLVHELAAGEYHGEFPDAPLMSEQAVADRSTLRARPTGQALPHWEPLWTPEYALDRLHHYYLRGDSVHFRNLLKVDSKLVSAIYRIYLRYDSALEGIGLTPADIRKMEHRSWNRENIVATLKERAQAGASFGIVIMRADFGGLIRAATVLFGSYESALIAAGLDPAEVLHRRPRLGDDIFRSLESDARSLGENPYDAEKIRAFHARYHKYIQHRYGNYSKLAAHLNLPPERLRLAKPPPNGVRSHAHA